VAGRFSETSRHRRALRPFQSLAMNDPIAAAAGGGISKTPNYYANALVLAYPVKEPGNLPAATITSGAGEAIDPTKLTDGDLTTAVQLQRVTSDNPASLIVTYASSQTIQSVTVFVLGKTAFGTDLWWKLRLSTSRRLRADSCCMGCAQSENRQQLRI
jgi:hypothetical protein